MGCPHSACPPCIAVPSVLQKLLKISEWSWSLAELVHAVVLLAHCHALASFVFGCGCEQEEGPGGRGSLKPSPPGNQCFCEAAMGNSCGQELLRINRKRVSPWGRTARMGMAWEVSHPHGVPCSCAVPGLLHGAGLAAGARSEDPRGD